MQPSAHNETPFYMEEIWYLSPPASRVTQPAHLAGWQTEEAQRWYMHIVMFAESQARKTNARFKREIMNSLKTAWYIFFINQQARQLM